MPEGLTQTKTPTFSETRPEIDRNGGRLHFGMVAGFKSERWPASRSENLAGINRNPHVSGISSVCRLHHVAGSAAAGPQR
jgi:hypothetical protein